MSDYAAIEAIATRTLEEVERKTGEGAPAPYAVRRLSGEIVRLAQGLRAAAAREESAARVIEAMASAITDAEYEPETHIDWGRLRESRDSARSWLAARTP